MPESVRMTLVDLEKQARGFRFTDEIGRGGLSQYGGILQEEFLRELRGDRWHKTVREMSMNDEIIGGILFAIDATLRKAKWDIQPGDETPENQARADFLRQCHVPGTKITVIGRSQVPIEEVQVGDRVCTHLGRACTVTDVMSFQHSGEIIRIRRCGSNQDMRVTPDHQLLVGRRPSGNWRRCKHGMRGVVYVWTRAEDVRIDDWLIEPAETMSSMGLSDGTEVWRYAPAVIGRTGRPIETLCALRATLDLARLSGYYAAEGFASKYATQFTFHMQEIAWQHDVQELIRVVFYKQARIRPCSNTENAVRVELASVVAAGFFASTIGCHAHTKRIPEWLWSCRDEYLREFLRGYFRGDGCAHRQGFSCCTASEHLAHDLKRLCLRLGIISRITTTPARRKIIVCGGIAVQQREHWILSFGGGDATRLGEILDQPYKRLQRNHAFLHNGFAHYPVRSVDRESYNGVVHNLEVASDHSFVADGVVSHNCLFDDLDQTWSDTVSEWLTFVPFGWAVCEMVMKTRNGDAADLSERSLFDDRKIGWRKIALRGQETLARWVFSEAGDATAMVQRDPVNGNEYTIPLEKCLHFRHRPQRGNPEGTSSLRAVYKTWYTKKRLQAFEAIGIERDLGGYPVVQLKEDAPDLWNTKDANATATLTALKKFVKSVRRDEQEGAIVPSWAEFKLLTTGSRRAFDTSAIINRHDQRIAIAFLWDIMLLGHEAIGTQALAQSKLDLLAMSLDGFLDTIATVVNRFAVPLLFRLNGENPDKLPRLFHDTIKATDLVGLGDFIMKLSQAGAAIFPNEDIERYLLRRADLPVPEETLQGKDGDGSDGDGIMER